MEKCGHYEHWRTDFDLRRGAGIRFLRYGPPLHKTWLGQGRYDWDFADLTFAELEGATSSRSSTSATSACRTGSATSRTRTSPSCSPSTPAPSRSAFPGCSSTRPSTRCSSAPPSRPRYGWWNEQLTSDRAFVTALKHIVKANVLAMHAILEVRPDAIFIQSESSEYFHAENPAAIKPAEIYNARRFLSLDLNYGRRVDSEMYEYLMDNGMTREEYHFFLEQQPASTTASWATTTTSPTSTGWSPDGQRRAVRRGVRLRRDHAAVLRPLPPARDAHRDQLRARVRTATRP